MSRRYSYLWFTLPLLAALFFPAFFFFLPDGSDGESADSPAAALAESASPGSGTLPAGKSGGKEGPGPEKQREKAVKSSDSRNRSDPAEKPEDKPDKKKLRQFTGKPVYRDLQKKTLPAPGGPALMPDGTPIPTQAQLVPAEEGDDIFGKWKDRNKSGVSSEEQGKSGDAAVQSKSKDKKGGRTGKGGASTYATGFVQFSAVFVNENGTALAGVNVYGMSAEELMKILSKDGSAPASRKLDGVRDRLLASSGLDGRVAFEMRDKSQTGLTAVYGGQCREVFNGTVSEENAWNNAVIALDGARPGSGAAVAGRVLGMAGGPLSGVLVCNRQLKDRREHEANLGRQGYVFCRSGASGEYLLSSLETGKEIKVTALPEGIAPKTLAVAPLQDGQVINGLDFVFESAGSRVASWGGRVLGVKGEPITDGILSVFFAGSMEEALTGGGYAAPGADGAFRLDGLEPFAKMSLYYYAAQRKPFLLDTRTLHEGEEVVKDYKVDLHGSPGALGFLLQDASGIYVKGGWLATEPVFSEADIGGLSANGGRGAAVRGGADTWLEGLDSAVEHKIYYGNADGQSFILGTYTLEPGERKRVGLVRLTGELLSPARMRGFVCDDTGVPVEGLGVEARYLGGGVAAKSKTNASGAFDLSPLIQSRYVDIYGVAGNGKEQRFRKELFVKENEYPVERYTWITRFPFTVTVSDAKGPVKDARVSLYAEDMKEQGLLSDADGKVGFSGVVSGKAYTLKIFHPFYEYVEQKDYHPDMNSGEGRVEISYRPGVKVRLLGPDFSAGVHVRAWIGSARDSAIVQDGLPGNEYDSVINGGELVFLTPPSGSYYVYVGGLPQPWAAGLYGPFSHDMDAILELPLERVSPVTFILSGKEGKLPPYWSLALFSVDPDSGQECQIAAGQFVAQARSKEYFLGTGVYRTVIQAPGFEPYVDRFELSGGQGLEISLSLADFTAHVPAGGYVRAGLVSDSFPLLESGEARKNMANRSDFHHGDMCFGFNKDWMVHLGGEASFEAAQLGDYADVGGIRRITWRRMDFESGLIDFRKLYPGAESDYSVIYTQFKVLCDEPRELVLGLASDDGIKVWLNSLPVLLFHIPRPVDPNDQNRIPMVLQKGTNMLSFKVDNSWGEWALRVRFLDPATNLPVTDLRLDPDGGFSPVEDTQQSGQK